MLSENLIEDEQWPLIYKEIKKVFQWHTMKMGPNGIIEVHGWSDRFTVEPIEGATHQYEFIFTNIDGGPVLKEIKPL